MTFTDTEIRRRPDGSIDTGHYMAHGRVARARQADRLTRKAANGATQWVRDCGAALVRLTRHWMPGARQTDRPSIADG